MNLSIQQGAPRFRAPRLAVAAAIVMACLGIVVAALPTHDGSPVVCPFRAVTGLPCATCGLIRCTRALMHGRVADAFALNPLDAAFLLVVAPLTIALLLASARAGVAVRIGLSAIERRFAWAMLGSLVIANWAYVLVSQG